MTTNRLEAFSDGVLAIIITIMVLELKVPEGTSFSALKPLIPKFISYIISFLYVGIYWNNHHHMFQAIKRVDGRVLWANLALLFFLSLIPFSSAWMGENHFDKNPVALYGIVLLLCAISFTILSKTAQRVEGENSAYAQAVKNNKKEIISNVIYVLGVVVSFFMPQVSVALYFVVAFIWLIPDRRIEQTLED